MKKCPECGLHWESCSMCRAGERHQYCIDDDMCHSCIMRRKHEKRREDDSPSKAPGYAPKLSPLRKLKNDYEHLLGRTWELFAYGKKREGELETAVANAWKQFERITECDDVNEIKAMAEEAMVFMAKILAKQQGV